jgi:hypothetical protein
VTSWGGVVFVVLSGCACAGCCAAALCAWSLRDFVCYSELFKGCRSEILSCFYFRTSIAKSGVLTYLYGIGNLGHDYGRRAHAHEALSHPPASIHTNWIVWGWVNLQHVGMRSIVRARPLMGAVDGAAIDPSHQLVERTGTH